MEEPLMPRVIVARKVVRFWKSLFKEGDMLGNIKVDVKIFFDVSCYRWQDSASFEFVQSAFYCCSGKFFDGKQYALPVICVCFVENYEVHWLSHVVVARNFVVKSMYWFVNLNNSTMSVIAWRCIMNSVSFCMIDMPWDKMSIVSGFIVC